MARELASGIWHVDGRASNVYLIDDDGTLRMVDAGTPGDADRIRSAITDAGYVVADVEHVLLTHFDYDHIGALATLAPDMTASVVAAEPDASYVAGEDSPGFTSLKGAFQRLSSLFGSLPDLPVERVGDGDRIGSFTVRTTPGHTPGHVAYVSQRRNAAALGDLVRERNGDLRPSPWYLSADTGAVRESIRSLATRSPDFDLACVGHGTPVTENGIDRLVQLAKRFEEG